MKRILSILLCALMVVAIIPMSVFMVAAEDSVDTLYENDFSNSNNAADASGANASIANGLLSLAGWGNNTWTKNVTLNGTTGLITISFTMQPNLQNSCDLLSVNGVVVLSAASNAIVINGTSYSASTGYNQSAVVRNVTVTVDPKTGLATVNYNHPSDASHNDNHTGTVNVGTIGDTLAVTIGAASGANSWSVDNLTVTQVAGDAAVTDTTEREEVSYFYSSFNISGRWEAQGGLFSVMSVGATTSTAVSGVNTYMVVPTDAGSDTSAYGFGKNTVAYPANSVLSIDFMLDTLPGEGEIFKFLKDRASYNNHIAVCGTANGTAYLYPNMGGAQSEKFYIEAGVWYTVQIFFGANEDTTLNAPVYAKKTTDSSFTYIGSTHSKVVGAQMNYDFVIEGSTLQYNVDNIRVDTRVDDIAVKVTGYQKTNVADGKYNVRFTAAIPELYAGQENVGFEIEAPDQSKSWDKSTTTVYNSLTANFGTETVNASDLGAKYVTAMAITGIPADLGTVELVVKPYVTINGVKFYGSAVTVTVNPVTE